MASDSFLFMHMQPAGVAFPILHCSSLNEVQCPLVWLLVFIYLQGDQWSALLARSWVSLQYRRLHCHPLSMASGVHTLQTSSQKPQGQTTETKFHTEPPWDRGTKVCSNGHSHVTRMAARPIYGKTL